MRGRAQPPIGAPGRAAVRTAGSTTRIRTSVTATSAAVRSADLATGQGDGLGVVLTLLIAGLARPWRD